MQTIEILTEYCYPVINGIYTLEENAQKIVDQINSIYPNLNHSIFIAGIGTSGAMIMTMVISKSNGKFFPMLYKKTSENSHRSTCSSLKDVEETENAVIVIVDDLICSGATLRSIKDLMSEKEKSLVKIIACAGSLAHSERVKTIFPSTNYFIA